MACFREGLVNQVTTFSAWMLLCVEGSVLFRSRVCIILLSLLCVDLESVYVCLCFIVELCERCGFCMNATALYSELTFLFSTFAGSFGQ